MSTARSNPPDPPAKAKAKWRLPDKYIGDEYIDPLLDGLGMFPCCVSVVFAIFCYLLFGQYVPYVLHQLGTPWLSKVFALTVPILVAPLLLFAFMLYAREKGYIRKTKVCPAEVHTWQEAIASKKALENTRTAVAAF